MNAGTSGAEPYRSSASQGAQGWLRGNELQWRCACARGLLNGGLASGGLLDGGLLNGGLLHRGLLDGLPATRDKDLSDDMNNTLAGHEVSKHNGGNSAAVGSGEGDRVAGNRHGELLAAESRHGLAV